VPAWLTVKATGVALVVIESFLVSTPFEAIEKWTTELFPWLAT